MKQRSACWCQLSSRSSFTVLIFPGQNPSCCPERCFSGAPSLENMQCFTVRAAAMKLVLRQRQPMGSQDALTACWAHLQNTGLGCEKRHEHPFVDECSCSVSPKLLTGGSRGGVVTPDLLNQKLKRGPGNLCFGKPMVITIHAPA